MSFAEHRVRERKGVDKEWRCRSFGRGWYWRPWCAACSPATGRRWPLPPWERPAPAIFMSHDTNTCIERVKVHYAEGMGLLAQLCEDITLTGFGVCLKGVDDPRFFTTQADATHFSGCKGKIISQDGLYEGMMDDAINVHGTYLRIMKRVDNHTVIGRYMHDQSWGFEWGRKGAVIFEHFFIMVCPSCCLLAVSCYLTASQNLCFLIF